MLKVLLQIKKFLLKRKLLVSLIVLAFLLRIYDIENNPKSLYGDELTAVYDAYSLFKIGKDQKGESWPLFFSMGGGRPAGYMYATLPFTAILGPTPLAARAVSVLSGTGIVMLLYLVTSTLVSTRVGILAAAVAAIIPWELSLSRGGFESHFALFLSLSGFYLFLKAKIKPFFYLLAAIFFALSMQTYSTYVLTIPLFATFLGYLNKEYVFQKRQALFLFSASVLILIGLLTFSIYTSYIRGSQDRFNNLNLFNQPETQNAVAIKVMKERVFSTVRPELALRLHNKYLESANLFLQNYLKNFGLDFLVLYGDKNPRHNPTNMGEITLVGLFLSICGAFILYNRQKQVLTLISGWLIIAPIAGSLVGDPHAIRQSFMLPPLIILMAVGLFFLIKKGGRNFKLIKIVLILLFVIQYTLFLYRFYLLAPNLNSSFWSYSAKAAFEFAKENQSKYDYILLSTSIPDMEFAYPVYAKVDPAEVIYQNDHKTYFGEHQFLKYGNIYLGSIPNTRIRQIMDNIPGSVLYLGIITDIGQLNNEWVQRDKDNSPLFSVSSKSK